METNIHLSSFEDYVANILFSSTYSLGIIGLLFIFAKQVVSDKKIAPIEKIFKQYCNANLVLFDNFSPIRSPFFSLTWAQINHRPCTQESPRAY